MINLNQSLTEILQQIKAQSTLFDDGRINYNYGNIYLYVQSIISCGNKILLLKRSNKVRHPGSRGGCGGFYDKAVNPLELLTQEFEEELGIDMTNLTLQGTSKHIEYEPLYQQTAVGEHF